MTACGTPRRVLNRTNLTQHRRLVMDAWGQARLYPGVNTPPNAASSSVPSSTTINVYLPHRLPGQLQGPGEPLVENRYRYYVPTLGQYLTPDPMHQASVMSPGPQAYAYANGNPLKYSDPDGRQVQFVPAEMQLHRSTQDEVMARSNGRSHRGTTYFGWDSDLHCVGCKLVVTKVWLDAETWAASDHPTSSYESIVNHEQGHVLDMNAAGAMIADRFNSIPRDCGSEIDCIYQEARAWQAEWDIWFRQVAYTRNRLDGSK